MHRSSPHASHSTRQRRLRVAHEAARLMADSGLHDYQQAKRKAAERLGIHDDASLPRNTEIEQALREHQRLFAGAAHVAALRQRRQSAVEAMEFLHAFAPRLAGPVLDGTADARSPVQLYLHSDDADAVQRHLDDHGIPAQAHTRRLRMDREHSLDVPLWTFSADELAFELLVLPYDALRQSPLSIVDDRPQRRATLSQLRQLLAEQDGTLLGT
ncbi:hypothetical protein RZA67_02830 [Stenotrophomonas sp. C3(2023)]|uniref:hypothetical protein n=1 Tax=Stenotrophomonas sp. C3(2023) TaxID=3080277 RepID=UPI00293C5696|nr:hypothetical protein [Stenotrophomonas sp. C3(2023)]MDV3467677.1 hypothetical protein [Stenotrophomonas sp. C3(2023)]